MTIFVTGGSGFLGQQLLGQLRKSHHDLFALARSEKSARTVSELGATPVEGDLSTISAWVDHLRSIDVVIHCAAPVEFWGPWEKFKGDIVDATLSLAKASAAAKVKRFIYISSEAVLQDERPLLDIDETLPYPKEPNSFYGKAKMLAEQELRALKLPMELIILRPSFIWGNNSPSLQTIKKKVLSSQFLWIDGGQAAFEAVHVNNVVGAIECALIHGASGEIYFITDQESSTFREFFEELFDTMGIRSPQVSIPGWLIKPVASFLEWLWRFLSLPTSPPLSHFEIAFAAMPRRYSANKAKSELMYRPILSRRSGLAQIAKTTVC